ncbi:MAG: M56 family metallopeptidase [Bacteroidia bacterium]|nr:M56 family metallopeptidase [Bacteroidia bacterium]
MNDLLLYLIKVSAGTILMYLFFLLFNSRDTFYRMNRIILLISLILPLVFPLLRISPGNYGYNLSDAVIIKTLVTTGNSISIDPQTGNWQADLIRILIPSWLCISSLFLIKILVSIFRTVFIIRKGTLKNDGFPHLVVTDEKVTPFSFYPYAVLPEHLYNQNNASEIIEHEFTHIRQGHTFDIILCEIVLAFFWFNPAVWFIRRSILLNHEFLADNNIVTRVQDVKKYQYQLLKIQTGLKKISLANSFNSLIRNRIIMINKKPTPVIAILKNLLIIPVVAILFAAFSFTTINIPSAVQRQEKIFSDESAVRLLTFIGQNTSYPFTARTNNITGKVFVEIAMDKGGKIRKINAFDTPDKIKFPMIQEVVIIGYAKPLDWNGQDLMPANTPIKISGDKLSEECLRVAQQIESLDLPEWKDKDLDFTLVFNFQLK